jgi:hypothetical protein
MCYKFQCDWYYCCKNKLNYILNVPDGDTSTFILESTSSYLYIFRNQNTDPVDSIKQYTITAITNNIDESPLNILSQSIEDSEY